MKTSTLTRLLFICCLCCTLTAAKAQYVLLPDSNFGTWLNTNGYSSCLTGNNATGWHLDTTCPAVLNATTLGYSSIGIRNITGIRYFKNLRNLKCYNSGLASVPALPPLLTRFECDDNILHSISSPLPQTLTYFSCYGCRLDSLPVLPPSLDSLDCSNNNLTFIHALPASLKYINCAINQLTAMPTLPPSLTGLYISSNMITLLPTLPNTLLQLNFSANLISAMPASLPPSLTELRFYRNNIRSIPPLPATLTWLDCGLNPIYSIPALPPTLNWLACDYDSLTSLPALPASMATLECQVNQLTSLPVLPDSLTRLYCSVNPLLSLPNLPPKLQYLYSNNTRLTSLPTLPETLWELDIERNQISTIAYLPRNLSVIKLRCNSGLTCLPRIYKPYVNELTTDSTHITCLPNRSSISQWTGLNPATAPLCDATSGCDFYYNIAGNVHYDNLASCAADSINPGTPITGMKVLLKQNGNVIQQFYTFNSGSYSFKTPSLGSYTIDLENASLPISVVCPAIGTRSVALSTVDSVKKYENFGMQCSGVDFGVVDVYGFHFRPTLTSHVYINAGNIAMMRYNASCGALTAGAVTTTYTNAVTYLGPAPGALTPSSVSGNTVTYNLADLNVLQNGSLDILLQTDANAVPGTSVCITSTITPAGTDNFPGNNILTQCFPIVSSYDPNHKDVSPAQIQQGATDWLTYSIHFQNTGSDTAYLVVLKDTLSANVDASSFQYLASSHHAVIQLDHNAMTFTFPHINLVDSATNPPLSEGWIQYRVKANPNLTNGTAINNTAYIYFDNNAAVVTNTATTNVTTATCQDTTITISAAICATDTFSFYGQALTAQGTYNDTMPRAGGCDSIISLTLTLHPLYVSLTAHDTICDGSSLSYHGQTLSSAGTYSATLQSIYGCDSIVSVALAVRASDLTEVDDTICAGGSYNFHGQTLTAAGMYMDTLHNRHGCDSVVMLMLETWSSDFHVVHDTICSGDTVRFHGFVLTATDTVAYIGQNVHGCDSAILLALTVRPAPVIDFTWDSIHGLYITNLTSHFAATCVLNSFPKLVALNGGTPAGGHYSGSAVQNDTLYLTQDTIYTFYYTYNNGNGCTASILDSLAIVDCDGIYDIANLNDIKLYPNPNTGTFTLTTSNSRNQEYKITNMLGEIIEQKPIAADTQTIDMSYAAAGVYTLSLKGARAVRFVVVK